MTPNAGHMPAPHAHLRRAIACVMICASVVLGGCKIPMPAPQDHSVAPANNISQDDVSLYLQTMHDLTTGNPARQADLFYEIEREYTRAPTTTASLRYALALITPGHPAANLAEGKRILETLLALPERMLPLERTLATVMVREADARLSMEAEHRRLVATVDERVRGQANSDRRLQLQADEIARLRKELAEAKQKLDAITDIERTITIERSPSPPGSRDNSNQAQSPPPGR